MAAAHKIELLDEPVMTAQVIPLRRSEVLAPTVTQQAGPFEVPATDRRNSGLGDILITGLLVIYPALATITAIIIGLMLSRG
ncbi:hypothetical protein [Mesorhizobium amorphae]|uniref:hypothetical protein n=1 Tax=Mesorhizobium amorphae TaxID=71433 RepID=UPI0021B18DA6|nr:hypothetical protein [Mesorhizobium amorphae]